MNKNVCDRVKLDNDLKALIIPHGAAPVVSLQAWIQFGSADEDDATAGIAHLFEHLLFKGTKKRGVGQIAREIEALGGDLNAYTSFDQTVMHMTLGSEHLETGIEILSDALINTQVDPEELAREKPVILEEIKRRNDRPGSAAADILRTNLFGKHPYFRPIIGYEDVVAHMPRSTILKTYKKFYNTGNMFITVCGSIEKEKTQKLLNKYFSSLPQGKRNKRKKYLDNSVYKNALNPKFKNHKTVDSFAHIAWPGINIKNDDLAALDVLCLILGQGESSRFNQDLIINNPLLRSIGMWAWAPKDNGSIEIGMKASGSIEKNYNEICSHVRKALTKDIRHSEIEKAQNNLLAQNIYSKETVDGMAERFAYVESLGGDWTLDHQYTEKLKSLSLDEIVECREKYLSWNKAILTGIVPEKTKKPSLKKSKLKEKLPTTRTKSSQKNSFGTECFDFKGLKVCVRTIKTLPLFSLRWVGLGGTRLEPKTHAGLGALWARTVTEGGFHPSGKDWNKDLINDFIDNSSASLSAIHGKNSFGFYLDGLSKQFEDLFDMTLALSHKPHFHEKDIKSEKKHILADLKSQSDSPVSKLYELFYKNMMPGHAYARKHLGDPKSVRALDEKHLKNYHKRLNEQEQVLCVTGDISTERVKNYLENEFPVEKSFQSKSLLKKLKTPKYPKKFVSSRAKMQKEQSHILWGFPTVNMYDKDRWAFIGLAALLSGQSGRLFMELRDKLSLCYSVAPVNMESLDGGFFGFYIGTSPENEEKALHALENEILKIQNEGISPKEWKQALEFYKGNHKIEQQKIGHQATDMALSELYNLGYEEHFLFEKKLSQVKHTDFKDITQKYFKKEQSVLAIVHP